MRNDFGPAELANRQKGLPMFFGPTPREQAQLGAYRRVLRGRALAERFQAMATSLLLEQSENAPGSRRASDIN
jgi:hypothetical protein